MIGHMTDPSWSTRAVSERAYCQLAPNPGGMTLDGTNTWILIEPGDDHAVVIDPGPQDEAHLRSVLEYVESRGAHVALTLLTHGHLDHSESAERFGELTGAPTRALADFAVGATAGAGRLEVTVVATPGHTSDSVSFLLPAENALLTGDTILGRGTAVIMHPDGELQAYLDSLRRIEDMTRSGAVAALFPGHGPVLADAAGVVTAYLDHRASRLDEIRSAIAAGARSIQAIVETVYAEVPRSLWPAATRSVRAQWDYLAHRGETPPSK